MKRNLQTVVRRTRISALFLISLVLMFCVQVNVWAGEAVIAGVNVHQTENKREIFITFNYPMHYASHDPEGSGSVLHVLLKPASESKWKTTADT